MDSAAIRQALRDTVGLTLDHPTADEAQEVLRAAAAAYADWLDGPTDEDVECLVEAYFSVCSFKGDSDFQLDTDAARAALEAVWARRKEE